MTLNKEYQKVYAAALDTSIKTCRRNFGGIISLVRSYVDNPPPEEGPLTFTRVPSAVAASMAVIVMQFLDKIDEKGGTDIVQPLPPGRN